MPNVWLLGALQFVAGAAVAGPLAMTNALVTSVVPYRMRSFAFSVVGLQLVFVGGILGGVLTGSLSDAFSARTSITIIVPISFVLAGLFIASAARHVKGDMARVVEELQEEQAEAKRVAEGEGADEVLQIRNLDFSYGPVQVLFDVDLVVRKGEVLALLGTNGAGKSTVLRAISGLALPERGVIRFQGRTITLTDATERVRRGIVQVPGGKAVFPTLTRAREPAGRRLHLHLGRQAAGGQVRARCSSCSRGCASGSTSRPEPCPVASSRCSPWRRRCCSTRRCC